MLSSKIQYLSYFTSTMMAAFASSTTRSSFFRPRNKTVSVEFYLDSTCTRNDDGDDDEPFLDCVDKQVDVFDFLEIERDDTSVSSSSSSSSLDDDDEESSVLSSSSETVYMDALHDFFQDGGERDERELFDGEESSPATAATTTSPTEHEACRIQESSGEQQQQQQDEGNPIAHVVHLAQNIWEGSKQTPLGLVINVTEGVCGGVFGHLVGLMNQHHHHDNNAIEDGESSPNNNGVVSPIESAVLEVSDDDGSGFEICLSNSRNREVQMAEELKRRLDLSITTDFPIAESSSSSKDGNWLPLEE